jgi:hypothetical protein
MRKYLGDSVYGDYSTGELQIYTDNGDGPTNKIILNGEVLVALFKFIEQSLDIKITTKTAAHKIEDAGQNGLTTAAAAPCLHRDLEEVSGGTVCKECGDFVK